MRGARGRRDAPMPADDALWRRRRQVAMLYDEMPLRLRARMHVQTTAGDADARNAADDGFSFIISTLGSRTSLY